MFEITKDRNLLSIRLYEAQTTPYVLDINTGIFLGQQGKPIKTTPKYWRENLCGAKCNADHPLRNIIYALYVVAEHYYNVATVFRDRAEWLKMLRLSDRFQSIGYTMDYDSISNLRRIDISDADFKAFAKYLKDHPNASYSEWESSVKFDKWCAEHNLTINEHFTRPMAEMLYARSGSIDDNDLKWYAYYLTRGLYDFGGFIQSRNSVMGWIRTYLEKVRAIGQEPQKGDFIRLYTDAVRTYELRKVEFDNRAIAEHQNSKLHALQFEDDNFIVRVPMTSAEVIDEGVAQGNCVGRLYLPCLIDHSLHIVFVRRKSDPETSYITCEVHNNGSIGQYLLRRNQYVDRNTPEHEFREKYQNFLNENWNRA